MSAIQDQVVQPPPLSPNGHASTTRVSTSSSLPTWLKGQSTNVRRHAAALRPFRRDEFGTIASAPTEAHLQAVNDLLGTLRRDLLLVTRRVVSASERAQAAPD